MSNEVICNSENAMLRDINTRYEVVAETLMKPCPKHGYMHSLGDPHRRVIRASADTTAWPDMPIRRAREHPHPYCSHPSCYFISEIEMVCYKCHDVLAR